MEYKYLMYHFNMFVQLEITIPKNAVQALESYLVFIQMLQLKLRIRYTKYK